MLELWNHRHIVTPIGWCPSTETLVVPFLPRHLPHTVGRDKVVSTRDAYWRNTTNWGERIRLAVGIAKSVAGLHAVGRVNCDWLHDQQWMVARQDCAEHSQTERTAQLWLGILSSCAVLCNFMTGFRR